VRKLAIGFVLGLFIGPLAILAAMIIGLFRFEGDGVPTTYESGVARIFLTASLRRVQTERNPYPVTDVFLLDGMRLFTTDCAGCHGEFGKRSDWGSHHFYPPVPQFGNTPPHWSEGQVFYIVQHGIRYSGMGGWSERTA